MYIINYEISFKNGDKVFHSTKEKTFSNKEEAANSAELFVRLFSHCLQKDHPEKTTMAIESLTFVVSEVTRIQYSISGYEVSNDLFPSMDDFIKKHGSLMKKSDAAKVLNVSRATVYAMIEDGRICTNADGTRVSMASVYKYLYT